MNILKEICPFPFGVCSFDKLKDNLIKCRKISEIPENAQSVIVFAFPYKVKKEKPLNISRYAAVTDYHIVVENFLNSYCSALKKEFKNNAFVPFVDNSPIPEVYAGTLAGLGVMGKNGLLITKEYGSFVFLGEIVTDLELETKNTYKECINCGLCEKLCPVGLNKENCISKITQQKKELSEEDKKIIKENGSVWGCDICAENCPLNKGKKLTNIEEFVNSYRNSFSETEDPTHRPYNWRGKEVILRNFRNIGKGD